MSERFNIIILEYILQHVLYTGPQEALPSMCVWRSEKLIRWLDYFKFMGQSPTQYKSL